VAIVRALVDPSWNSIFKSAATTVFAGAIALAEA
jgi:hypothetical protein